MKRIIVYISLLFFGAASLSSCAYAVAAGAGATGGYVLKDKGYKVQSPVKKEKQEEEKK